MKYLFKQQLEENKVVTNENKHLILLENYHNGDKIQVGDKPLFAMMREYKNKGDNMKECHIKLIKIKEQHFDLYEIDKKIPFKSNKIPNIKLKK